MKIVFTFKEVFLSYLEWVTLIEYRSISVQAGAERFPKFRDEPLAANRIRLTGRSRRRILDSKEFGISN